MGGVATSGQLSLLREPWIRYGQVSVAPVGQSEHPSGRQFSSSFSAQQPFIGTVSVPQPPAPNLDVSAAGI